ncbi:MAG TPA: S1 RNA-binding domain-containing protein [Chloroflexota bacterium]|nr:S1 RNA-binding domain-containing protein [Chloroflexota bacterium]
MEDLSERSTTQPQPEQQPAEPSNQAPEQSAETQATETVAAEQPSAEPVSASEATETKPTEAPKATEQPAAPQKPKEPTGPKLSELRPGTVVEGKVTRVERYGAFVNLGLAEKRDGLIHISELASYRVRRVEDVVNVGDEVRARVVSVDPARGRIALSLNEVPLEKYNETTPSNEPTLTAMALAFQEAYSRKKESDRQAQGGTGREDKGSRARREQQQMIERYRNSSR